MSALETLREIVAHTPTDPGERERTISTRVDAAIYVLMWAPDDEPSLVLLRSVAENRVLCSLSDRVKACKYVHEYERSAEARAAKGAK